MKLITITALFSAPLIVLLSGCESSATEAEKAAFSRNVLQQENQNEQQQFDQAIDPGYQSEGVGQVPAWEDPAY